MSFTYSSLISAYFHEIKESFSSFNTNQCREYVRKYRKGKFDEQKFMGHLAIFLQTADEDVSDYSLDDDGDRTVSK